MTEPEPGRMEVALTFQCGDNLWKQSIMVDADMNAHAALKMLAECCNRVLLQIGKDTGVFSR